MKAKKQRKIYFMPRTSGGKKVLWVILICFILIYLQYWAAMIFNASIPPIVGLLPMIILLITGIFSLRTIIKYKDYSIFLFLSILIWLWSILFIIGEFIFSH